MLILFGSSMDFTIQPKPSFYWPLQALHYCLNDPQNHPEIAIYGIGGTGKSAAAVEFAYQARKSNPILAVFWVSSFTKERFLESYREIALQVKISKTDDSDSDVL